MTRFHRSPVSLCLLTLPCHANETLKLDGCSAGVLNVCGFEGFSAVTAAKRKLRRRLDIKNTLRVSLSTLVWDSVVAAKQAGEGREVEGHWFSVVSMCLIFVYTCLLCCVISLCTPPPHTHTSWRPVGLWMHPSTAHKGFKVWAFSQWLPISPCRSVNASAFPAAHNLASSLHGLFVIRLRTARNCCFPAAVIYFFSPPWTSNL